MERRSGGLDRQTLTSDRCSERGATAVEYGVLVALIAAVVVATIVVLSPMVKDLYEEVQWW
jgi:pilus assembly protein Flp/PilA